MYKDGQGYKNIENEISMWRFRILFCV